jgi:hypothetical protein
MLNISAHIPFKDLLSLHMNFPVPKIIMLLVTTRNLMLPYSLSG